MTTDTAPEPTADPGPAETARRSRRPSIPKPDELPTIQQALVAVMADVGAIPKTGRADPSMGGYRFRGIDQFYEAIQPALIAHGVVLEPQVIACERSTYRTSSNREMQVTLVTLRVAFIGPGGDRIEAVAIGEGSDASDKSATKAMSTAMKYALMQTLAVPVEGEHDADQGQTEARGNGSVPSAPMATTEQRTEIDDLRREMNETQTAEANAWFKAQKYHMASLTATQASALIAKLTAITSDNGASVETVKTDDGLTDEERAALEAEF